MLPGKAPPRRLHRSAQDNCWGPRGLSPRQEETLRSRREEGCGGGRRVVHRGRGGEQGIHRSRWRTDGSDYHSILRGGEREAERPGERGLTVKKKESEYVFRLKQLTEAYWGGRESIDMLLWCLKGERDR